ncbi:MAG: NUDIX domain-containing protein [Acidimicrobiales bacterium]
MSQRGACVRELLEELGVGTLLVEEHQTGPDDKGDSIMFVYDGGVVIEPDSLSLELSGEELSAARFVPIDEIGGLLPERQARRPAAAARSQNRIIEMVNGHRSQ